MFCLNWMWSIFVHFGNVFYYGFGCFVLDSIWFESLGIYFRLDTPACYVNIDTY